MGVVARCAVIGSPIAHSLSPVLHAAAYRELRLHWAYEAHEVTEQTLDAYLGNLGSGWRGLSVTMPLKRAIISACSDVEPRARLLSSVNTVVITDGSRHGYNTDVTGFVRAFAEAGVRSLGSVVVVGGGATAASALAAVSALGARRVLVLARSTPRAAAVASLGSSLGLEVDVADVADTHAFRSADAVISTVPVQAHASLDVVSIAALAPVVFEVGYDPRVTALAEAAQAAGSRVVEGFALLLYQAARQVELMTGATEAPVEAMRRAGLEALERRIRA
jgi:shikimate dehydrogenase